MHLKPCGNCPHKEGCATKAERLASLRGLGFTSVNFKCDKRLSELRPGQRIEFGMADGEYDYSFTAIVMRPSGTRILVWLDDCQLDSGKNPIKLAPDRVTPIDGRVALCSDCDQPKGTTPQERKDGAHKWFCPRCAGWQLTRDRLGFEHWVEPKEPQAVEEASDG